MPILLNKTIRLFLDSVGRREEYEYYLNKFHHAESAAFALLCPVRAGFEEVAPVFTFDLETLLRLELFPVIVLCGEEALEMSGLLVNEAHSYRIYEWGARDSGEELEKLRAFIGHCRREGCVAILQAEEKTLEQLLEDLIPEVSRRVHVIRPEGQLRADDGTALSYYYTSRPDSPALIAEDQWIVELAKSLLARFPATHVSVASPWNLLEELFTVKGAGCVLRRGSQIMRIRQIDTLDKKRLVDLLESSFGRSLCRDGFLRHIDEAYLEKEYQGAALLERVDAGMYLSKFAVGVDARGSGLSQELWHMLIQDHPQLFWRARGTNPVNQWYEKQADGWYKTDEWRVFWRGIGVDDVSSIIRYSLERPGDFTS